MSWRHSESVMAFASPLATRCLRPSMRRSRDCHGQRATGCIVTRFFCQTRSLVTELHNWVRLSRMGCLNESVAVLHSQSELAKLAIAANDSSGLFRASILERLLRGMVGLQCRAFSLWGAGPYRCALLLEDNNDEILTAEARLILENLKVVQKLNASPPAAGASMLLETFVWRHHVVFQEVMCLLAYGGTDGLARAKQYIRCLFSGHLDEKGAPALVFCNSSQSRVVKSQRRNREHISQPPPAAQQWLRERGGEPGEDVSDSSPQCQSCLRWCQPGPSETSDLICISQVMIISDSGVRFGR